MRPTPPTRSRRAPGSPRRWPRSRSRRAPRSSPTCALLPPGHHALERWDDLRPRAGVRGLMQPVMTPVFNTMATGDVLLKVAAKAGGALAGLNAPSYEAHLMAQWAELARTRGADTGQFGRGALQRGGFYEELPAPPAVRLSPSLPSFRPSVLPSFDGDGEFVFLPVPSSMYFDGRGANRPWLLENPDPVTKIT